ncbi:MAG: hypothetical protein ABEJ69_01945 [Candidatus Nanohaloarchaea archaeon]
MLLVLSHLLAFSALFVASLFDLDTTDVPDDFAVIATAGGVLLHAAYSYSSGAMSLEFFYHIGDAVGTVIFPFFSPGIAFNGFLASMGEPLLWSLAVGIVFSIYGWGAYLKGMWGGADAFAMTVLGFAAPFFGTPGIMDPVNLFVNVMLVGLGYTLVYGVLQVFKKRAWNLVRQEFVEKRYRVLLETAGAALLAGFLAFQGMNPLPYFVLLEGTVLMYHFFSAVQERIFTREVAVEQLEGGEVPASGQGFGDKIVGLDEEDIEALEVDELEVRRGVPFMPVFPMALLVTMLGYGGVQLILVLFQF